MFFGRCEEILKGTGEGKDAWEGRLRLVEVVERETVFEESDEDSRELLEQYIPMAMVALSGQGDCQFIPSLFKTWMLTSYSKSYFCYSDSRHFSSSRF